MGVIDPRTLSLDPDFLTHTDEPFPYAAHPQGIFIAMIHQALRDALRGPEWKQLEATHWLLTLAPLLMRRVAGTAEDYFRKCVKAVLPTELVERAERLTAAEVQALADKLASEMERFVVYRLDGVPEACDVQAWRCLYRAPEGGWTPNLDEARTYQTRQVATFVCKSLRRAGWNVTFCTLGEARGEPERLSLDELEGLWDDDADK